MTSAGSTDRQRWQHELTRFHTLRQQWERMADEFRRRSRFYRPSRAAALTGLGPCSYLGLESNRLSNSSKRSTTIISQSAPGAGRDRLAEGFAELAAGTKPSLHRLGYGVESLTATDDLDRFRRTRHPSRPLDIRLVPTTPKANCSICWKPEQNDGLHDLNRLRCTRSRCGERPVFRASAVPVFFCRPDQRAIKWNRTPPARNA